MNANSNHVHPKENIPSENNTKVALVRKKSKEHKEDDQCASTCSCEEESITGMEQGVTDTVWKAGCYKINPTTQSGKCIYQLHFRKVETLYYCFMLKKLIRYYLFQGKNASFYT